MEKQTETKIVLVLNDTEECDMLLHGLDQLPRITQNVNKLKLDQLKGTIQVIRQGVKESFNRL